MTVSRREVVNANFKIFNRFYFMQNSRLNVSTRIVVLIFKSLLPALCLEDRK